MKKISVMAGLIFVLNAGLGGLALAQAPAKVEAAAPAQEAVAAAPAQETVATAPAKEAAPILKLGEAARVDLANALSKLKIKGRLGAGYYRSGDGGSFPDGSFEVPEAKLQFGFEPDSVNSVIMRLNLNNATIGTPAVDYLFLQSKDILPFLADTPLSLGGRLGEFKLGFGEETWSDNPVEGVLPSNSAGKAGVTDEGLELNGKIKLDAIGLNPLGWVASVSDGNDGVGKDVGSAKAFMGKLYHSPIAPLYLSATYYNSGTLNSTNTRSAWSVAGLNTQPAGSTEWSRGAWEVDVRYDIGKGKKPLDPPAYSDSLAIIRLSYGGFTDDAKGTTDRKGNFGFAEVTVNLCKKIYVAGRYSIVALDNDATATLNGVTANEYDRTSVGAGYRWSDNTIVKIGYDWNKEIGKGISDANNNLVSALVTTQF